MDKPIHCIRISKHILYPLSYSFFSWMIIKNTFSFSAYSIHIYFFNLIGFRTKLSAHFPFNDIVHRSISLIQNRCQKMWCTHHFGLLKNALKTSQSTRQVVVKYLQPFTKWQKNSTPSHPSWPYHTAYEFKLLLAWLTIYLPRIFTSTGKGKLYICICI